MFLGITEIVPVPPRVRPSWIRRRNRLLATMLAAILAVLILGLGIRQTMPVYQQRRLDEKRAELKRKGIPLTYEDLAREDRKTAQSSSSPQTSPADSILLDDPMNSSDTYRRLSILYYGEEAISDTVVEAGKDALREFSKPLLEAHRRIRLPDGRIDFDALRRAYHWFNTPYSDSSLLFLVEAITAARQNDPDRSFESVLLALSTTSNKSAVYVLLSLCKDGLFSENQLNDLEKCILQAKEPFFEDMRAQRVFGLENLKNPDHFLENQRGFLIDRYIPGTTKFLLNTAEIVGYSAQQQNRFLDAMECIEPCYDMPRPAAIVQMRPLANELNDAVLPSTSARFIGRQIHRFVGLVLGEADANAQSALIPLERFYRAEGRYPAHWSELCPRYLPTPPKDPCVDAPLCYRASANAYTLYSIGLDQNDDLGRHQSSYRLIWEDGDYVLFEFDRGAQP